MAHKKGQGSVKNGRDSQSKRLGVKKYGSEVVIHMPDEMPPSEVRVLRVS